MKKFLASLLTLALINPLWAGDFTVNSTGGSGSITIGSEPPAGDNLGNHIATATINAGFGIDATTVSVNDISVTYGVTASTGTFDEITVSTIIGGSPLYIDAEVGIGNAVVPNAHLSVPSGNIFIGPQGTNNTEIGAIKFGTDNLDNRYAMITSSRGADAANIDLRFFTMGGDVGGVTERLRIQNDGNITTRGTSNLIITNGNLWLSPTKLFYLDGGGDTYIAESSANNIQFTTNGTPRMNIDSSGNVGIGTAPSYPLHVIETSSGTIMSLTGSSDGGRPLQFNSADNGIFLGAIWDRDVLSGGGIHTWSINGSEKMRLDTSGNVGIGTTPTELLHISKDQNAPTKILLENDSTGVSSQTQVRLNNGSGVSDYAILSLLGKSFTTSGLFEQNKLILFDGNSAGINIFTQTATPIQFGTQSVARMRIDSSGDVTLGTGSLLLPLNEKVALSGFASSFYLGFASGRVDLVSGGSTRIDVASANIIEMRVNSANRLTVSDTGVQAVVPLRSPSGTVANPGVTVGDTTSGMSNVSAGLRLSYGGNQVARFNASSVYFDQSITAQDGSVSRPSYGFNSDTDANTGMYWGGEDQIAWSAGGTKRMGLFTYALSLQVPIRVPDGTVSLPSITFGSDTNTDTGFWWSSENTIGIANGGVTTAIINSNRQVAMQSGSASLPPISAFNDVNSGIYWGEDDTVRTACGGLESLRVEDPADLTTTETSLWLYDDDNGTIEQVTVGAADSGGSGYKVLRIPN